MNRHDFYLALDNAMLVERLKMYLAYVSRQWDRPGRPLVVFVVTARMLSGDGRNALLDFMNACREGQVGDTPVQLGRVAAFLPTAARERIDILHGYRFPDEAAEQNDRPCYQLLPSGRAQVDGDSAAEHSGPIDTLDDDALMRLQGARTDLPTQFEVLSLLSARHGLDFDLNKNPSPDSLQLYKEALDVLMLVMSKNPELRIDDTLYLDVIIGHAVRLAWERRHPGQAPDYDQHRAKTWKALYLDPPSAVANHVMDALVFLLGDSARAAVSAKDG